MATLEELQASINDLERALEKSFDAREEALRIAHLAPMAVGMDTRDLVTAVRKLVDFAWASVS